MNEERGRNLGGDWIILNWGAWQRDSVPFFPFLSYFMLVTRSVTINVFASMNRDERNSFKGCQGMSNAVLSYLGLSRDLQKYCLGRVSRRKKSDTSLMCIYYMILGCTYMYNRNYLCTGFPLVSGLSIFCSLLRR